MRLVPESNDGKILFFTTHLGPWGQDPQSIGLSADDVAELEALTAEANAAHRAQRIAQNAARSATMRMQEAVEAMAVKGATMIQQIRARAAVSGPEVYSLAKIPAPAAPSPVAEPGKPTRFAAELSQCGSLTLTWTCKNPRGAVGTMYHVSRRIGWSGEFKFLAAVGEKKFTDTTIPPGTAALVYQVQAVRSRAVGPTAEYVVNFGGGAMPTAFTVARPAGKPVCVAA